MGWRTYELEDKVARLEKQIREQNRIIMELQDSKSDRLLREAEERRRERQEYIDREREPGFDTLHSGVERDGYVLSVELEEDDFYFEGVYQLILDEDDFTMITSEALQQMKDDYHNIIEKYYPCGFFAYLEYVVEEAIRIDYCGDIKGYFIYPNK